MIRQMGLKTCLVGRGDVLKKEWLPNGWWFNGLSLHNEAPMQTEKDKAHLEECSLENVAIQTIASLERM